MAHQTQIFRLRSSQTALAFVLPEQLCTDINSLRRIYDKSFRKWDPHINILYPFVDPSQLPEVTSILLDFLATAINIKGCINDVGVFRHRRNATVFLKPESNFEVISGRLRAELAGVLGCSEMEGTHDGVYRPHMTVGQAGLNGNSVERLMELAGKLAELNVELKALVVLKRDVSGVMRAVEELPLRKARKFTGLEANEGNPKRNTLWRDCYHFTSDVGWEHLPNESRQPFGAGGTLKPQVQVLTYNIMAEPLAISFQDRLSYIMKAISSVMDDCDDTLRILCLQEVDAESLPLLLSHPFIQQYYGFSSHYPESLLPSHRNLVTLASCEFIHHSLQFKEMHKSSLIIYLHSAGIQVANFHLSAGLNDEAVLSKKTQVEIVRDFLFDVGGLNGSEIILAGHFNLTTSSRTLDKAIFTSLITRETAETISTILDEKSWEDSFGCWTERGEEVDDIFPGEEGATFDRRTNPFAMNLEGHLGKLFDYAPQRYDRILFHKGG